MADRLRELLDKIKEWWGKFTTKQRSLIIGAVAATVLIFAVVIYFFSKPQYTQLYTCESAAEAAKVVNVLESAGIPYTTSQSGLVISVETNSISTANLALGSAGYLSDDLKLSDYISTSITSTTSVNEKNYVVYLEKKLERDIQALKPVRSASVHLSIPTQNGTLLSKTEPPSAYIQLDLQDTFTSAQAANLAKAVATSLGSSSTEHITIIDNDSNMLFTGGEANSTYGVASSMQELEKQAASAIAAEVKKVLLGTNQYSMVEVSPHLSVDYSSYEDTLKEYYANDGRTEGMIAQQDIFNAEDASGIGGVPGTDSNDGTIEYEYRDNSQSSSNSSESSTSYLPNEHIVHQIKPAGYIKYNESSVSITAIKYNIINETDVKTQGLLDGTTWEEYKINNAADRKLTVDDEFYSIVSNATGISASDITIVAYETPVFFDKPAANVDWNTILSISMIVIILGLLALVIFRTMSEEKVEEEPEELSVEDLLQSKVEPELEDIDVENKSETRKAVEKFVDENPEAAVALLRNWLNDDWG